MARRPPSPAAFLQMFGQQEEAETPSFPMKEAQREMLAIAVDRSRLPHQTFVCGDAVRYGPGFGPFTPESKAGLVFIFWRYLDPDDPLDQRRITDASEPFVNSLPDIDCLIAHYDGRGPVEFAPACSYFLLPGDE